MSLDKHSGAINKYVRFFKKGLPSKKIIFGIFLLASIVLGLASVALVHYQDISTNFINIIIRGILFSIIALIMPTILTILFIKLAIKRIYIKHIIFLSLVGEMAFALYILLGSILYIAVGITAAIIIIIAGAASIFGWWFFAGRMLISKFKSAPIALLQPTLYILFYLPASVFLFNSNIPLNVLLIKLYAGMLVFGLVIYAIMYVFNKPLKKSLGMNGIDTFTAMFQDWVFGISTQMPFGKGYGVKENVQTDTIIFSGKNGQKCMLFVPNIHYGAMGNIGGSNFPYLLEKDSNTRYKTKSLIMHTAVNEDMNPTFSQEISKLKAVIFSAQKSFKPNDVSVKMMRGKFKSATVTQLHFGNIIIAILSRAPNITEDISPDVAILLKKIMEGTARKKVLDIILIDAHNSRKESVNKIELEGIKMNSEGMNEYVEAIKHMENICMSKHIYIGAANIDFYKKIGSPIDIANGNLNALVFKIGGYRYVLIQFNSNNMLPSLREQIIKHVREKYNVNDVEVCTTDTHAVNSISMPASNVLGRKSSFVTLKPYIDVVIGHALDDVEKSFIYHHKESVKNLSVWGANSRERIFAALGSVVSLAKFFVPTIIIAGFIIAVWIISII